MNNNEHRIDTATFNRNERTATCSTCGTHTAVVAPMRPGQMITLDSYVCKAGRKDSGAFAC